MQKNYNRRDRGRRRRGGRGSRPIENLSVTEAVDDVRPEPRLLTQDE